MLMPFVPPIIKEAWDLRITWFIPIWISMTVTAALGVWWRVAHIDDTTVAARDEASAVSSQVGDRRWNRGDFVAMFLLLAVVACYVTITLVWEDFADFDSSQLTLFTLKRHNFPPPIWSNGRFFPLGMQEFNLLRYFTHSVAGYHFLHTIEFLVLSALIFFFGIKFGAGPAWQQQ